MATRERATDRGSRMAAADALRAGAELRQARVSAGLSLADVGRTVGLSASQISRIERGRARSVTVVQLCRLGAVVGLNVRVRTYPGPDPLRDAGQVRLIERLRVRLHPHLRFRTEVELPERGDQRAWDGWVGGLRPVGGSGTTLAAEAETRITDLQALLRRLHTKMRDGGVLAVLLVVADTRANRAAVAAGGLTIAEVFPVSARQALRALAKGEHPGGSSLVFL